LWRPRGVFLTCCLFPKTRSHDAQRRAHDAHTTAFTMPSNSAVGATKRKHATDTRESSPQAAIPGLLDDIVVTHILRSEYFDDPADLARLPAVSHAMRDSVAARGLQFKELLEHRYMELGCLSALQRLQRGGRLSRQERLCQAAARGGQLEELKVLRADGSQWDKWTC
jgi:hypothetical protein